MLGIIEGAQQQRFAKYVHKAAAVAQAGRVLLVGAVAIGAAAHAGHINDGVALVLQVVDARAAAEAMVHMTRAQHHVRMAAQHVVQAGFPG